MKFKYFILIYLSITIKAKEVAVNSLVKLLGMKQQLISESKFLKTCPIYMKIANKLFIVKNYQKMKYFRLLILLNFIARRKVGISKYYNIFIILKRA
jgi:hypothetical protein